MGYDRPIWVNLLGPDPETLTKLINEFAAKVAKVPGIADMETSEKALNPALSIRLNNDAAADLGISVQRVGATVRPLLAGETVTYWLGPDGQNYEVNVQLPRAGRQLASDLGNLYLSTNKRGPDGELRMVPLRQVADIVESTSPQIIKRQDLQRRVALYANAEGRPSGNVGDDVKKIIDATVLPPGYRFAIAGQQEDTQESMSALVAALGLAIIFIYLVLASQFASFTQPIAIMASLPFTLIGVLLALLLTGTTLNILSMIGFVMLMGLVTKNAILLVDFANRSRRGGASLHDALLTAGTGPPAAHHDDDGGDDFRHAAAGAGPRRERGNAGSDGSRDHRWGHDLDAAHARRRAGHLHLPRPSHRMAPRAGRRGTPRVSLAQTRLLRAIDVR